MPECRPVGLAGPVESSKHAHSSHAVTEKGGLVSLAAACKHLGTLNWNVWWHGTAYGTKLLRRHADASKLLIHTCTEFACRRGTSDNVSGGWVVGRYFNETHSSLHLAPEQAAIRSLTLHLLHTLLLRITYLHNGGF